MQAVRLVRFYGGPAGGSWQPVPVDLPAKVPIHVQERQAALPGMEDPLVPRTAKVRTVVYRRTVVGTCPEALHPVYALEGMTPEEVAELAAQDPELVAPPPSTWGQALLREWQHLDRQIRGYEGKPVGPQVLAELRELEGRREQVRTQVITAGLPDPGPGALVGVPVQGRE